MHRASAAYAVLCVIALWTAFRVMLLTPYSTVRQMEPGRLLNCKKEHAQMRQDSRIRQRLPLRVTNAQDMGAHALVIIPGWTCIQSGAR